MGLFKRGDIWWMDWRFQGQRYRESSGTHLKSEAEAILRQRRKGQPSVVPTRTPPAGGGGESITLLELQELWLTESFEKKSLAADELRFRTILAHFGEDRRVGEISGAAIEAWKKKLRETRSVRGKPLAPATVNRHLALLKAAINLAIRKELVEKNPCKSVRLMKEDNRRERICSREEFDQLVEKSGKEPQLQLAIIIAYWTAMRQAEITSLAWGMVDLERRMISVLKTKNGEPRSIPIHDELLVTLQDWKKKYPGPRLITWRADTISTKFRLLTRRLGLKDLVFHSFRHSALTNLRRAGADVLTLKRIGGHKTTAMLDRYCHVSYDDMKNIFDKMG